MEKINQKTMSEIVCNLMEASKITKSIGSKEIDKLRGTFPDEGLKG